MSQNPRIILAIESAIAGGSIALLEGRTVFARTSGSATVSRAEDLLPNVNTLLIENSLDKSELGSVAISLGPGSYTGLRIGIATVMGLCKGLEIGHIGVHLFDAIAAHVNDNSAVIALPMGKTDICLKVGIEPPRVISASDLAEELNALRDAPVFAHSTLFDSVAAISPSAVDIGSNLADYVGIAAQGLPATADLRPIYIQNPRFG